ncbi:MAG: hypothetical protein ACK559_27620, partial [bacterium]
MLEGNTMVLNIFSSAAAGIEMFHIELHIPAEFIASIYNILLLMFEPTSQNSVFLSVKILLELQNAID